MAERLADFIGARVESKRVGDKRPFVGVVEDVWLNRKKDGGCEFFCHVREGNGELWHRGFDEIELRP